jgi:hypothetical protein
MKKPATTTAVAEQLRLMREKLDFHSGDMWQRWQKVSQQQWPVDKLLAGFFVKAAVAEAWRGNIEPLKQLYPDAAPFLQAPPPRKRTKVNDIHYDILSLVVRDVHRIRDYWKQHYNETIRNKKHGTTAVKLAIEWWDDGSDQYRKTVTEGAIIKKLKPSGPHKRKKLGGSKKATA